jgi:hypothetical protein
MQQMINRIEDLEKQLKKMEEETKARKTLEITEEEKKQEGKEILEAVSREYTLDPAHTLGIDYSLSYSYSPSEDITTQNLEILQLRRISEHTITHNISTTYGILDNLSANFSFPIVYRYNKVGTSSQLNETDIGDIGLGTSWQPPKKLLEKVHLGDTPSTFSFSLSLPTGRSPYKINPNKELSTGSGLYSFTLGANFSKQVDPVVVFWSVGYGHSLPLKSLNYTVVTGSDQQVTLDKVDPGDTFTLGGGLGYALSYVTSINLVVNYRYAKSTQFTYKEIGLVKTADSVTGTVGLGMGWRVSQKTTLSFSLGMGLTDSSFSFTFRVPFTYML